MPKRPDPLAERVRQSLLHLMGDMTQTDLAARAGVTKANVHKFVRGGYPFPPLTFLDRLMGVFGLTLAQIIGRPEAPRLMPPVLTDDEAEMLALYRRCRRSAQRQLARQLLELFAEEARRTGGRAP